MSQRNLLAKSSDINGTFCCHLLRYASAGDLSNVTIVTLTVSHMFVLQRSYPPPEEIANPANAELLIDDILNPQQAEMQRPVWPL